MCGSTETLCLTWYTVYEITMCIAVTVADNSGFTRIRNNVFFSLQVDNVYLRQKFQDSLFSTIHVSNTILCVMCVHLKSSNFSIMHSSNVCQGKWITVKINKNIKNSKIKKRNCKESIYIYILFTFKFLRLKQFAATTR